MNSWVLVLTTWISLSGAPATDVVIDPIRFYPGQRSCEKARAAYTKRLPTRDEPRQGKVECIFNGV